MLKKVHQFKLSEIMISLCKVFDYISPRVANHHLRVAFLCNQLAETAGMDRGAQDDLFWAAIMHDIGAFSEHEKYAALEFEHMDLTAHAERGYLLINDFPLFSGVAPIIRHHHRPWAGGKGREHGGEAVPLASHILHLADRIEILIDRQRHILSQTDHILKTVRDHSGEMFAPDLISLFEELAAKENFWLDITSSEIQQIIVDRAIYPQQQLDLIGLVAVSKIYSHIIDFRSPFTAVHSAGVSAVSTALARLMDFSDTECVMMQIAGYLHDIGKLAIPLEILNKPGPLNKEEFSVIKGHVYHSYRLMEGISSMHTINQWASFHHERIDGNGYPFHVKGAELPLGARIMAVSDVFTAITEDRPYRKGMNGTEALRIIKDMADNNSLDRSIVALARNAFEELNDTRISAQVNARQEYLSKRMDLL